MKIHQVPGSSTHAVIDEDGTVLGHFANEVEARQFARAIDQPVEGTAPAIPTEEPKRKVKKPKKHKQSR